MKLNNPPKLLIVEDEPIVRASVADALQEAGYLLLESGTGEEAIAELGAAEDIAGIVTDIRLGAGPNGWEVASHARQQHPRVAIVYMTGDSAADWASKGVPNSVIVQKPFAVAQVITAMSNLLNVVDLSPTKTSSD